MQGISTSPEPCVIWDRDPSGIASRLGLRAMAWYGVRTTCAIAPTRMLAAMAAATT